MSEQVVKTRAERRVELQRARRARRREALVGAWRGHPRLFLGLVLGVLVVAAALVGASLLSGPEASQGDESVSAALQNAQAGPYDLTQAPPGFELAGVVDAKFLSLSFPDAGGLRSMMLTRDRPEFQEMAAAIAAAERTGDEAPVPNGGVTLAFVTEQREVAQVTLGGGSLFFWQGAAYEASGDLQTMAERVGQLLEQGSSPAS